MKTVLKYTLFTYMYFLSCSISLQAEPGQSSFQQPDSATSTVTISKPSCALLPVETGEVKHISKRNIITLKDQRQLTITNVSISPFAESELLTNLLTGAKITISSTGRTKDRHNRLLGQITVENTVQNDSKHQWVQEYLVKNGYAMAYARPHNTLCTKELLAIEAEARASGKGEWQSGGSFKILPSNDLKSFRRLQQGSFQIVEGKLINVAHTGKNTYLNFSKDWRTDFTAVIHSNLLRRKDSQWPKLKALTGKNIRVRGWLDFWNGPMIRLETPEMLEIVE